MIRLGFAWGLITVGSKWFRYRELRNITTHVYDPAKAAKVFGKLTPFLRDADALPRKPMATNA